MKDKGVFAILGESFGDVRTFGDKVDRTLGLLLWNSGAADDDGGDDAMSNSAEPTEIARLWTSRGRIPGVVSGSLPEESTEGRCRLFMASLSLSTITVDLF